MATPEFQFDTRAAPREWRLRFEKIFGDESAVVKTYTDLFVKHKIRQDHPPTLTDANFQELGIPIGHRGVISDLIAKVQAGTLKLPSDDEMQIAPSAMQCATSPHHEEPGITSVINTLDCGFEWIDFSGEARSMETFMKWVNHTLLLKGTSKELPDTFHRAFEDNKPLSFVLYGETKNAEEEAILFLLRVPTPALIQETVKSDQNTIAMLTNRIVFLFMGTPQNGRLLTYHKTPSPELQWLQSCQAGEAWEEMKILDPLSFLAELLTHANESNREILMEFRKHLEILTDVPETVAAMQIVEAMSKLSRQAQVLKRCLNANLGVLNELKEMLGTSGNVAVQTCDDLFTLAEEIEANAIDTMNLRMGLVGFRAQENMKVFTYISAVTSPMAVMTGWYGMNFENMPELKEENAYWGFIAAVGAIVVIMIILLIQFGKPPKSLTVAQLHKLKK
eukprot:PhF_6_TR27794/c0_g1_i2/m.40488